MVKVTGNCKTIHSTPISRGKDWDYLSNITTVEGYVAQCNKIATKTGVQNKPYEVNATNYGFDIPSNAVITAIQVRWKDRIVSSVSDTDPSTFPVFSNTRISFRNCNVKSVMGEAPKINFSAKKIVVENPPLKADEVNSIDFGVNIQYSFNNSNNVGAIFLDYIRVDIIYEIPTYNVSMHEPRHEGASRSWSTEDDPTLLRLGDECKTTVYFRSTNGYDGGTQTVRIHVPLNYKLLSIKQETGELIVYEDKPYVDWVVNAPLNKRGGLCKAVGCDVTFTPRGYAGTSDLISAEILSTGQKALYYVAMATNINYEDDLFFIIPELRRIRPIDDPQDICIQLNVTVPKKALEDNFNTYPMDLKLWSVADNEYVPFNLQLYNNNGVNLVTSAGDWEATGTKSDDGKTYHFDIWKDDLNSYSGNVTLALDVFLYNFEGDVGEYEFRAFIPHDYDLSEYDMYSQNVYIKEAIHWEFECKAEKWEVKTPNMVTSDGIGYSFLCKTANGFQYKTKMGGSRTILEPRRRHIGGLILAKSHYEPKLKFSNKVNSGGYKNRAYYNKSGQWDHDLSLNIYLPKFDWRTLQEFVKMDKPVAIDTCPTCSDDDVLNHRGFVEVEDISNVQRVNGWWYKGEIGVRRITDKYWGKATIVKGARVCNVNIPFIYMNIIKEGDYYLNYYELRGGGQLLYDSQNDIINQIIVPTGENLHLRSKWASKDIDDYKYMWRCVLPSEATDESNDYKHNSIVYSVINNLTGDIVLTYTLYDFTTYNEVGTIVNTCKASCTVFDNNKNPTHLFTKQINLDYSQNNPTEYSSTTRFEFDASLLTISESGMNGQELVEREISLPSGEYLMDIAFCNNDVGLIEPDFICYMNMDIKENILANTMSNFYPNMLISPFVIPSLKLLFYRYSDDGVIYYYYGDISAQYIVDGFQQYKGGVDLQTPSGASILYVDNYTSTLYLNNGLVKIGFDRVFGTVSFHTYDAKIREFAYCGMIRIDNWSDFDILHINDDKASIQFGDTIWTMWRGHPYVQCQHINTDLVINDIGLNKDYNTVNCEALMTQDGEVIYDGFDGKKEQYLFSVMTYPFLTVSGENAPTFISGDEVTLSCKIKDRFGNYLGSRVYPDAEKIGKVKFYVDGFTAFYDPTPSLDEHNEWVWTVTFTPPFKNADYDITATLIPVGDFTGSTSSASKISVRKVPTRFVGDSGTSIQYLSEGGTDVSFGLVGDGALANKQVKIYTSDNELLETVYTGNDGYVSYHMTFDTEGTYEIYAKFTGDNRYTSCLSQPVTFVVIDDTKTEVTLEDTVTIGNNGNVTFAFTGADNGNIKLTIEGVGEYNFDISTTKTIRMPTAKTYEYTAEYEGTEVYSKAVLTDEFTLSKANSSISCSVSPSTITLNESVEITVEGSISNMKYIIYDNDSPVKTGTLTNGTDTIEYSPFYSGTHNIKAVYKETAYVNGATSSVEELIVETATTELIHANGDVYKSAKDYVQLVDSNGDGLKGQQVKFTVNGVTYNRTTDNEGYAGMDINLNAGTYPIHVAFMGDDAYQYSSLDYDLTVKPYITQWKKPQGVESSHQTRTAPYQIWEDVSFDSRDGNNYATCGNSVQDNECISDKNGAFHTPDQLKLFNFGLNVPNNAQIKELRVRVYERQQDPKSESYPNIGNAVISMQNHEPRTCKNPPLKSRSGFNVNEVVWSNPNVGAGQINDSTFTMFLNHAMNNSNDTGALFLKYFEVGIVYSLPTTRS